MQPHRIHLKGPWTFAWVECDGQTAECEEPQRVHMPISWRDQLGSIAGRGRFVRPFGQPTNLDADERVTLCFDGVGGTGVVSLNGVELGEIGGQQELRFDVTSRLNSRNILIVELSFNPNESTTERGGLWGPVALEIA